MHISAVTNKRLGYYLLHVMQRWNSVSFTTTTLTTKVVQHFEIKEFDRHQLHLLKARIRNQLNNMIEAQVITREIEITPLKTQRYIYKIAANAT